MNWTEKYCPSTLNEIKGNPFAINVLRSWAMSWDTKIPDKRAVVITGNTGIGKTSLVKALANEMGWEIIEINSYDQQTVKYLERIALHVSKLNTFSDSGSYMDTKIGIRKLIIIDDDDLFENYDHNPINIICKLIETTLQPVVLIFNNFYSLSRKNNTIKSNTVHIILKKPSKSTVSKILYKIAEAEKIGVEPLVIDKIAKNADGDIRAAIIDFELISVGNNRITSDMLESLPERSIQKDIYKITATVLHRHDIIMVQRMLFESKEDPKTISIWIDENLPYKHTQYNDLVRQYKNLSNADIFIKRAQKYQYYRFFMYANDIINIGIANMNISDLYPYSHIRFPEYIIKMSRSKYIRSIKKSIIKKLSLSLHTSTRCVVNNILPYIKIMATNSHNFLLGIIKDIKFNAEELKFIIGNEYTSEDIDNIFNELNEGKKYCQGCLPKQHFMMMNDVSNVPENSKNENSYDVQGKSAKHTYQRNLFDF